MPREIKIDNQIINDDSNCFVIAEIGNNHQGKLENAKKLITLAKQSGVSAVKFQKRDNINLFTEEMFDFMTRKIIAPTNIRQTCFSFLEDF